MQSRKDGQMDAAATRMIIVVGNILKDDTVAVAVCITKLAAVLYQYNFNGNSSKSQRNSQYTV